MADPTTERRSPYQGLIPYEEADAPFFFGREKEARLIIANLFASPLTLLYGASGVGKSSVLQAGVARQLRERDDVLVIVFRSWQSNPASQLKQAILNATAEQDSAASQRAVASLPSDRLPTLNEMLTACAKQLNRRIMVILDQFEEYFVYYPQGDTFAQEFPQAVTQTDSPISFLISIREDALAKLDYFEGRVPILFDNYLRIEHLDRQSARAAIEQPIKQFNQLQPTDQSIEIESRLADEVLKQVEAGKVTLGEAGQGVIKTESSEQAEAQIETPYLQLVMTRLWDEEMRAGSHRLRLETLNKLGGAKTIVRTHLDASMSAFPADQQEIAARVFHYLVTPSGTKIAHSASDLAEYANLPKSDLTPMLETLSQSGRRILRPVDPAPDQPQLPRYEIFHDVLAPAILDWRARHVQMQKQAEVEQLAEEQRRKAEEQTKIARRFRLLAIAMFVMFLLALASTGFAFVQRGRAVSFADESKTLREEGAYLRHEGENLRQSGEKAQQLAAIAQHTADEEHQKAERLLELAETRKKEADLAKAEAGVERQHAEQKASETRVAFSNLLAVQSKVLAGSFPQRSLLLAAEALNATRADDPRVPGAEEALQQALAQSGGRSFGGHEGAVNYVAISPDNRWLVTTDEIPTPSDSTNSSTETHVGYTRLWNITATGPGANSRILPNAVRPMVFSPDNHWLVAASKNSDNSKGDSFVRLWNLTASDAASPTTDLPVHKGPISTIKFSSDNRWLVTGSEDGAIYLWDLKAENFAEKPFRLGDTNNPVITVAISPDNRWLVTSNGDPNFCRDGIARLWDLNATDPAAKHFDLVGHRMAITEVAFSSDSQWFVTGCRGHYGSRCSDHSPRLWKLKAIDPSTASITSIELPKHDGPIRAVTFSPDNHWVITGGGEIARMFDITAADPTANSRDFPDHGGPISDLTVSPNNKWLVTVTDLGDSWTKRYIVRLWDLAATNSATPPVVLSNREHPASAISISNDNHWLVTCDANNITQVWDLTINYSVDGAGNLLNTPQVLRGHDGSIASVSFSPDSKRLVTGSNDKSARLWDLTSSRQKQIASPIALQSEHDTHFAISDDHHWLVTIGGKEAFGRTDTIAQVWDLTTQDPAYKPIVLQGHTSAIFAVAFSPDNHWLATSSHDQTARVWDLTAANPAANSIVLRGHTSVVSTVAFSPDKRWLITGSFDGTAYLWRMTPTGPEPKTEPAFILGDSDKAKRDKQAVFSIYTSPDSRWLVTSGNDSTPTRLWDLMAANPALNPTILSDTYRVAISPDSHWLVTTDKTQKTARLWNLISKESRDLPGGGYPFAFSADHRWLVACNSDVRLWDLSAVDPIAKSVVLPKGYEKSIEAVTFSPDNHWLVTGNADNTTRLWNMKDLAASPIVLKGHTNSVYRLAISADSHWLATGSFYDKFVRLWDLTSNNPTDTYQIFPINGNTSYIAFSNESAGSRWLVTGNYDDRTLLLWNLRLNGLKELACRTAGRNLTEEEWRTYFPGQKYRSTCPGLAVGQ